MSILSFRVIETKAGVARYDGKMLTNVPKIKDLPLEVGLYNRALRLSWW